MASGEAQMYDMGFVWHSPYPTILPKIVILTLYSLWSIYID